MSHLSTRNGRLAPSGTWLALGLSVSQVCPDLGAGRWSPLLSAVLPTASALLVLCKPLVTTAPLSQASRRVRRRVLTSDPSSCVLRPRDSPGQKAPPACLSPDPAEGSELQKGLLASRKAQPRLYWLPQGDDLQEHFSVLGLDVTTIVGGAHRSGARIHNQGVGGSAPSGGSRGGSLLVSCRFGGSRLSWPVVASSSLCLCHRAASPSCPCISSVFESLIRAVVVMIYNGSLG